MLFLFCLLLLLTLTTEMQKKQKIYDALFVLCTFVVYFEKWDAKNEQKICDIFVLLVWFFGCKKEEKQNTLNWNENNIGIMVE